MLISKPKILVIAADQRDRELVRGMLPVENYDVILAANTHESVAHLSSPVDLIICELKLRDGDCLSLLHSWQDLHPTIPFVLLAGMHEVPAAVAAMKHGAADYVLKPLNGEELIVRINKWIEASRKDERLQQLESRLEFSATDSSTNGTSIDIPLGTSLEDLERAAVEKALEQHRGNRTHAARTLGISVRTLQRKLKAWRVPMFAVQQHSSAAHFSVPSMQ